MDLLTYEPIESSSIGGTGFDAASGRFAVIFKRTPGTAYVYADITAAERDELLGAESPGSAIGRFAKGRDFEKLPD